MALLAIDPGKEHFGYSVFRQGVLIQCGTQHHTDSFGLYECIQSIYNDAPVNKCLEVVMEKPENYIGNNKKKSLQGLFDLCSMVDQYIGVHKFYHPKAWKGQVPKPAHHRRLQRVLSESELLLWSTADHNAKDAIGIGLYHLGRTKRGGTV